MTRFLIFILCTIFSFSCQALDGEIRSLEKVFSESDTIIQGAAIGSGLGGCAGQDKRDAFYIIKVTGVAKGSLQQKEVKVCGNAPILLGNQYLISGNKLSENELKFYPDAVLLVFPAKTYYRLISYDGPIVKSDRGDAYAVGLLEPNFNDRFHIKLEVKKP